MSSNRKYDEPAIPETIIDTNRGITYVKGKFCGKGGFAKCYEIKDVSTGNIFAGKIVSKKLLVKTNQKEKMAQEINIHRNIKHEHIVGFHSFFEDDNFVYVVLELCHKRSMMELHRRRKALTEPETRYYMKQILEGVLYLHENGIIHRDLKLGNLFLNENLEVKIGDFGLAAKIEFEGQRKRTLCGTPNYIAPEILTKSGHGSEVDIWSIGCIMYTLLVGIPPFESKSLRETYERIKRCEYKLPSSVRYSAAALINRMLQPDPKKRPTVKEILYSDFITSGYLPSKLPVTCLMVAPRFDSAIDNSKQIAFSNRKPLIEVNDNSPIVNRSIKIVFSGDENARGKGMLTKLSTNNDCFRNLMDLRGQLVTLLKDIQVNKQMNDELTEEMTDPAAQPVVWISKWVDYSDKYGFGYQLCDGGFGVMFNDNTRILLHPNQKNIHYINQAGTEFYHTVENTPSNLEKKVKLLNYFRRYMDVHLMRAGAAIPVLESDQLSRIPYLHQWRRTKTAVLMHLTNGTVQINFNDHKKIIMCPLMNAVTYIDLDKNFRTYRFSTISSNGCVNGLRDCLKYAFEQIDNICSKETVSGY